MTAPFILQRCSDSAYQYVSFSVDHARIDDYKAELEARLRESNFRGPLLLDLLASNGPTRQRFFEAQFDGHRIDPLSLKRVPVASLNATIRRFCEDFYSQSNHVLGNSVLTPAQRWTVSRKAAP